MQKVNGNEKEIKEVNRQKKYKIGFWICMVMAMSIIVVSIIMTKEVNYVGKDNKEEEQEEQEEEIKKPEANNNEGIIKDRTENGMSFTETTLTILDSGSSFSTLVTNMTEEEIEVRLFEINFKDEKGEVIATLYGYVGGSILPKESKRVTSNIDVELKEAVDIEYKVIV